MLHMNAQKITNFTL